jgi:hypothetical protein
VFASSDQDYVALGPGEHRAHDTADRAGTEDHEPPWHQ